eukprot:Awhi_evm1s4930
MAPHQSRNQALGSVSKFGRSAMYRKRALYKKQKSATVNEKKVAALTKTKTVGGDKNGKTRVVALNKDSKFYPVIDSSKALKNRKNQRPTKFRASLTPGTVLILLAGKHEGRRVVLLGTLPSGLLLVSGPYKVNGVPLRRVNPAYVIATSASVDTSAVDVSKFDDAYFQQPKKVYTRKSEEEFFAPKSTEKNEASPERVADQAAVDGALMTAVAAVPQLEAYLHASFTLKKGQFPHLMKF